MNNKTRYTFRTQHFVSNEETALTEAIFHEDYLPNVIQHFEEFLRGAGFYFEGHLEIVNDEEKE